MRMICTLGVDKIIYLITNHNNRRSVAMVVILVVILGNMARTRAFDTLRAVDILQLIAVGVCIGIVITNSPWARRGDEV